MLIFNSAGQKVNGVNGIADFLIFNHQCSQSFFLQIATSPGFLLWSF